MGFLRGWSVKAKSIALLLGFALFLSGVYGGFTTFLLRREVSAAHDRLQQTARLVAAELDAQLEAGKQRLATVAGLPGLVHGLQRLEEAQGGVYIPPWTTLHYLFFKSPVFTGGVFLLDRTGKALWTEPPGLPWLGSRLADEPTVAAMFGATDAVVSAGLAGSRLLSSPHVVVGIPIAGPDGETAGLLAGVIDLGAAGFTGTLQAISTAEGRYLSVVDQNERVISSTDPSRLLAPLFPTPDVDSAPLAFAALREAPWRVVAGESRQTALAPIRQLQRVLLGVGAVMLILAMAVSSRLIRGFVSAVERLTRSAEVMAGGDLSQPVIVDGWHRELATLGQTFERMRIELRASHAVLMQRLAEREDLMRLKEEFLANISHELRTPLNVIFGYTDILIEEEGSADRRDTLARIRAQSEQLLQLVGDLMTLSGLNAGKITLELYPTSLADVVERVRPLVDQLAQGKSVGFVCECPASLPVVYTDPLRLEQILTNLLTNAFKFTSCGNVGLRVRHAVVERRVRLEVADTGIGIPAHELPHIFDEFRQVDGSMSREHGGIGLGLALVRRLVGLLGGEVTVASRAGEGSTFTVTLPIDHPTATTLDAGRAA
jgi:signal transduction histidine kinase